MVFLDAFVPKNGESVQDLTGPAVKEGLLAAQRRAQELHPRQELRQSGV
jgi:hypothetical protein